MVSCEKISWLRMRHPERIISIHVGPQPVLVAVLFRITGDMGVFQVRGRQARADALRQAAA